MSLIITDAGRSWIASVVKDQQMFLALGAGLNHWDTDRETTFNFSVGVNYQLPYNLLAGFSLVNAITEATVYVQGVDYTVNLTTGVVTRIVGGAIETATGVKAGYHVNPPNPLRADIDLEDIIGWKKIEDLRYVIPDPDGLIETSREKYSVSVDPTPYLMITATLMSYELSSSAVREAGIWTGTVPVAGQPGGRTFFTPVQIQTKGELFARRIYPTINRSPSAREQFQYILPF